jgi:DNA-directed RNA polymerase subunit RPC12/RpoP
MKLIETTCTKCGKTIHALNKVIAGLRCPECVTVKQFTKYMWMEKKRKAQKINKKTL